MYAIIECSGHQYQVRSGDTIAVQRLALDPGADFSSEKVLLVGEEGGQAQVGTPYVEGFTVQGTVMGHFRDKKIVVFKMKRRKGYRRTRGHRQEMTRVKIDAIKKPAAKKAPAAEPKTAQDGE